MYTALLSLLQIRIRFLKIRNRKKIRFFGPVLANFGNKYHDLAHKNIEIEKKYIRIQQEKKTGSTTLYELCSLMETYQSVKKKS